MLIIKIGGVEIIKDYILLLDLKTQEKGRRIFFTKLKNLEKKKTDSMSNYGSISQKEVLQIKFMSRNQAGKGTLFDTKSKINNTSGAYSSLGGGSK